MNSVTGAGAFPETNLCVLSQGMGAIAANDRTYVSTGPDRVAAATLACIAEHGVRAVTVEHIADEAGVSRASVYRWFPGGRSDVLLAAGGREMDRFFAEIEPRLAAADTLDDVLAEGLSGAVRFLRDNKPLHALLEHEPELVLPHLAFHRMGTAFAVAAAVAAELARASAIDPDTELQLRADAAVPYGRVVEIMGIAQKAGLGRIGFVAEPGDKGR